MGDRARDAPNPEPVAERGERADDIVVERHVSQRRAVLGGEIEMGEAHGVAHVPVHDLHRQDRLRLSLDRFPCADMVEETTRPFGDRNRAQRVCAYPRRRRRIDDGYGDAFSHRLLDRGGERQSGWASAGDDDVVDGSGFGQCGRLVLAHCRTDDKSIPALGPPRHFRVRFPSFQGVAAPFPSRRARRPIGRTDARRCDCAQSGDQRRKVVLLRDEHSLTVGTNPILSRWVLSPALRRLVTLGGCDV